MATDTPNTPTPNSTTPATPKAKKPGKAPKAKKPKVAKRPGKPAGKAATKGGGKDVNKSEEVRKLAAATKASGTKPRPSVIVAELAKRGIKVATAQVSLVLKKMGFRPLRKRRKKAERAAAGTPKAAARKTAGAGSISVDDLLAAKKAVAALGGTEHALETIQALKRLGG
jgi:hypothetical protein